MKPSFAAWGERYLYAPSALQRLIAFMLLPVSSLYCAIMYTRFRRAHPRAQGIPVVSIGNLTVGGSGKTPLSVALALRYKRPAIVLRGYGRQSRGLFVVCDGQRILCDVTCSGDEAMLYALLVPHAVVIVSEERETGIARAREHGCECVFLDDGYGKHHIDKLDIVIDVDTPNRHCLPSGPYRERLWSGKPVTLVREGVTFSRHVRVKNGSKNMALVTAIARPERLDPYLPDVVSKHYFPDHHFFTEAQLRGVLEASGADTLLVTQKDYVKMRSFNLPLAWLELTLTLDDTFVQQVESYIRREDENTN